MTKIYVAGSWQNRELVKIIMDALESHGHDITEDWTTHEDPELGHEYAHHDIIGIVECDIFVMFLSDIKSFGKAFEMGYAVANNKPIIAFGDRKLATSVFFKLAGTVDFKNDEVERILFINNQSLYDNITALIKYLK